MSFRLEATTRLATATAAVSVLSLGVGCGARAPKSAPAAPAEPAPSSAPASRPIQPRVARGVTPRGGSIRIEAEARAPAQVPRPRLEFLAPTFGETLPELAVRKQEVSVQAVPPLAAGLTLAVSLDGMRPRPIEPAAPLVLGDLVAEDRALSPGPHSLLLVVLDDTGAEVFGGNARTEQVFALVDFYVGGRVRALPAPDAERLFCLGPTGTYHGAATERPLFELFAIGNVARKVPLRIEAGALVFEAAVDPRGRYRISGLPAGDVQIAAGETGGARAECTFTLNPERQGGT